MYSTTYIGPQYKEWKVLNDRWKTNEGYAPMCFHDVVDGVWAGNEEQQLFISSVTKAIKIDYGSVAPVAEVLGPAVDETNRSPDFIPAVPGLKEMQLRLQRLEEGFELRLQHLEEKVLLLNNQCV